MFINNKAKIISSDIISTNGIIHIIDKLLSPQNLLITPQDASGRILVSEPIVTLSAGVILIIYYLHSYFEALFQNI